MPVVASAPMSFVRAGAGRPAQATACGQRAAANRVAPQALIYDRRRRGQIPPFCFQGALLARAVRVVERMVDLFPRSTLLPEFALGREGQVK